MSPRTSNYKFQKNSGLIISYQCQHPTLLAKYHSDANIGNPLCDLDQLQYYTFRATVCDIQPQFSWTLLGESKDLRSSNVLQETWNFVLCLSKMGENLQPTLPAPSAAGIVRHEIPIDEVFDMVFSTFEVLSVVKDWTVQASFYFSTRDNCLQRSQRGVRLKSKFWGKSCGGITQGVPAVKITGVIVKVSWNMRMHY